MNRRLTPPSAAARLATSSGGSPRASPVRLGGAYSVAHELPPHLRTWQLPPGWRWGSENVTGEHRHFQELVDALGRSLSLVTAPDSAHEAWLEAEARNMAHRNHPSVPTTYHYWGKFDYSPRGPGYLRRWIAGETVGARIRRVGVEDVPTMLQVLRGTGSALSYLHDTGVAHGAVGLDAVWTTPTGQLWLLGWQWALPPSEIPSGLRPDRRFIPVPPEWGADAWAPTPASDQWQLAAICFALVGGEVPPSNDVPPLRWVRPDVPQSIATVIDRALDPRPEQRYRSVASLLRAVDRVLGSRTMLVVGEEADGGGQRETEEGRLRWALGDDYEVLAALGRGSFGSVWRVRDLTLEREVALKMLHPHIAADDRAVARFRRGAQLAAQLAHPAIVPIYDWDSRGDVSWYTMELAEGGSVADLIAQSGPRPLADIATHVDLVLDGLAAAHAVGIVHRDLKPENILIDRYRRLRITDFGIASAVGEEVAGPTGTPAFAAPEQLLGEAQGPPVDSFAIAAIVFFSLTGELPFGDQDAKVILARQLAGQVDLSPFPEPIAAWLRRGLAADADARFPDASSMQAAWRSAVSETLGDGTQPPWWRRWSTVEIHPGVRGEAREADA
jgi:serine/threonine-protein kinase